MLPKLAKSKLRNFELQSHHNEVYYLVYHNMDLRHMIDYKITMFPILKCGYIWL